MRRVWEALAEVESPRPGQPRPAQPCVSSALCELPWALGVEILRLT